MVSKEEREKRLALAVGCATRHVSLRKMRNGQRTTREAEIIAFTAIGLPDEEIAARLCIRVSALSSCWKRILTRFGASTRTEA